ncbi:MAG: hypothetical protein K1X57_23010 [Gemmataceae bacterium]|nr:hypothetical protein [Gemmataceae bacterium]
MTIRRLNRQHGVSYSLPFVLVIPFYLTFMAMTVEVAFLLQAKLGTMAAAHAAGRAARVWLSAQPVELREQRIRQAAWTRLASYIGGRQHEIDVAGPVPAEAESGATEYAQAAGRYLGNTQSDEAFLRRKYRHAAARAEVRVEVASNDPRAMIKVTVRFRAPLYVPVASRFLDPDMRAPFEYPMTATATIPNDAPLSESGTLGIEYDSDLTARGNLP